MTGKLQEKTEINISWSASAGADFAAACLTATDGASTSRLVYSVHPSLATCVYFLCYDIYVPRFNLLMEFSLDRVASGCVCEGLSGTKRNIWPDIRQSIKVNANVRKNCKENKIVDSKLMHTSHLDSILTRLCECKLYRPLKRP